MTETQNQIIIDEQQQQRLTTISSKSSGEQQQSIRQEQTTITSSVATNNIMPPASTMANNDNSFMDVDPFAQFGALSLDTDNKPAAPETPPSAPKTDTLTMTMMGPNVPGMTGGLAYQQHQQQQQPMQVTPEQQPGQIQPQYQQQAAPYMNNPYGVNGQSAQIMQPPQVNNIMPPALGTNNPQTFQAVLTSPPVSPLWAPNSPEGTPPPEGSAQLVANTAQQQASINNNGNMLPSLPADFGAPATQTAPVPSLSPSSPGVAAANPFDMFAPTPTTAAQASPVATSDPFATTTPGTPAPVGAEQSQQDDTDFWNDMGFGAAVSPNENKTTDDNSPGNVTPTSQSDNSFSSVTSDNSHSYLGVEDNDNSVIDDTPVELDARGLPVGGEYYKARVTTPMLGAIFSSAKELRSTLFKTASNSFVEAIGERPVISFTIDGSAADTAGICLGHVLLKVNDVEVFETDEAVKTVGAAPRPMTMEFYIPGKAVKVLKTEAMCMVKYDNHSTEAPASACEWKAKYVVVGDMLGKPHIVYMYRSKVSVGSTNSIYHTSVSLKMYQPNNNSFTHITILCQAEYDIAVKESQTRNRALSIKVKQFDIRGARIFHEQGSVRYPNMPKWYYFTIVRGQGPPIKISTKNQQELYPVLEGVSTFLDKEGKMKRQRFGQNKERMQPMQGMYRETYY